MDGELFAESENRFLKTSRQRNRNLLHTSPWQTVIPILQEFRSRRESLLCVRQSSASFRPICDESPLAPHQKGALNHCFVRSFPAVQRKPSDRWNWPHARRLVRA